MWEGWVYLATCTCNSTGNKAMKVNRGQVRERSRCLVKESDKYPRWGAGPCQHFQQKDALSRFVLERSIWVYCEGWILGCSNSRLGGGQSREEEELLGAFSSNPGKKKQGLKHCSGRVRNYFVHCKISQWCWEKARGKERRKEKRKLRGRETEGKQSGREGRQRNWVFH